VIQVSLSMIGFGFAMVLFFHRLTGEVGVDLRAPARNFGLFLVAFGTGGIKPCVSTNVGDQFTSKDQHLIERAFSYFYLAINAGSSISIFYCPVLLRDYGPRLAFGPIGGRLPAVGQGRPSREQLEPVLRRAGIARPQRGHALRHHPIRRRRYAGIKSPRDPHEKSREPAKDRANHTHAEGAIRSRWSKASRSSSIAASRPSASNGTPLHWHGQARSRFQVTA